MSFVYFASNNKDAMWIGYSTSIDKRVTSHAKYGFTGIAFIPATEREEAKLHEYFSSFRLPWGNGRSVYKLLNVLPYVEKLLDYQYAAPTLEEAEQWPCTDFMLWAPDCLQTFSAHHNNQLLLFATEQYRVDKRDEYETPEDVIDVCREALGGTIDTDPCSNVFANRRIKATTFYTQKQNGLSRPWLGRVFLNPPYSTSKNSEGDPLAAVFCQKLISEFLENRVQEAITVLNLQSMPTRWFPRTVWMHATAHAVWSKRIDFIRPRTRTGSKPFSSSKNGTIFSYFGLHCGRFAKVFAEHGHLVFPGHTTNWNER